MPGPGTGERGSVVGKRSCTALLGGTTPLAEGVRLSEPGTLVERLCGPAQGCCEAFGGELVATDCALSEARALGGLTLVGGRLPAVLRFLRSLALLKPEAPLAAFAQTRAPGGLLTLFSRALAAVRRLFTEIGRSVALIGDPIALIRGQLTLIGQPLALVGHAIYQRLLGRLATAPTLAAQPIPLSLESRIVGREPRLLARHL